MEKFKILSPEGQYLGDTRFPENGVMNRGRFCAVRYDEETGEVDYVIYRIESAVPGFVYP